jgi:hypothetical protein
MSIQSDELLERFRSAVYSRHLTSADARASVKAIEQRSILYRDWQSVARAAGGSTTPQEELMRHWVAADVTDFRSIPADEQRGAARHMASNRSSCASYDEILPSVAQTIARQVAELDAETRRKDRERGERNAHEIRNAAPNPSINAIVADAGTQHHPSEPWTSKVLESMTYKVRNDGSVLYLLHEKPAFVDHGRQILLEKTASDNDEALLAALLLAREKYGPSFDLTGSDAFKRRAIEVMVKHKIDATLKDSGLEEVRLKLSTSPTNQPTNKPPKVTEGNAAKATSSVGYPGGPSTDYENARTAANAFHDTSAAKQPHVIRTATRDDGRESAASIASTSLVERHGAKEYGKSVSGVIDPVFKAADEDIKEPQPQRGLRAATELPKHADHIAPAQTATVSKHLTRVNASDWWTVQREIIHALAKDEAEIRHDLQQLGAEPSTDLVYWFDRGGRQCPPPNPLLDHLEQVAEASWRAKPHVTRNHLPELAEHVANAGGSFIIFEGDYLNAKAAIANRREAEQRGAQAALDHAVASDEAHQFGARQNARMAGSAYCLYMRNLGLLPAEEDKQVSIPMPIAGDKVLQEAWSSGFTASYDSLYSEDVKRFPELWKPVEFLVEPANVDQALRMRAATCSTLPRAEDRKDLLALLTYQGAKKGDAKQGFPSLEAAIAAFDRTETSLMPRIVDRDGDVLIECNPQGGLAPLCRNEKVEAVYQDVQTKRKEFVMATAKQAPHPRPDEASEPRLVLRGVKKLDNGEIDTTVLLFKGHSEDYLQGFVKVGDRKHQVLAHLNQRKPDEATGEVKPNFITLCEPHGDGEKTQWKKIGFGNALNQRKDGKPVYYDEMLFKIGAETLNARITSHVDPDLHGKLGFLQKPAERPQHSEKNLEPGQSHAKSRAPEAMAQEDAAGAPKTRPRRRSAHAST